MAFKKPKFKFDWRKYQSLYLPASILLGGLVIALAIIFTGGLNFSGNSTNNPNLSTCDPDAEVPVSVDNDAVLGDPNAPLTLIEFVDYECPFCKSFFEETLPQIKSQYIDTGKLKLVMRDFPLDFHDPAATDSAIAANCAREQGGDSAYFSYHDEIFTRTGANGQGLPSGGYEAAAKKLGLNTTSFNSCLKKDEIKSEVTADLDYLSQLIQDYPLPFSCDYGSPTIGTPAFFLGKSDSSGTIQARFISGAQPFASFSQLIDSLLSE